jgi:hypothetical protein
VNVLLSLAPVDRDPVLLTVLNISTHRLGHHVAPMVEDEITPRVFAKLCKLLHNGSQGGKTRRHLTEIAKDRDFVRVFLGSAL